MFSLTLLLSVCSRFWTNYLDPDLAMVPRWSIKLSLLMPMPLSWMISCPFDGRISTLMVRSRFDWFLNLCFSRASEAFDSNSLTKTSLSV